MVLKSRRPVRAMVSQLQDIVNEVNDTPSPHPELGLNGIAPCKGRTSRIGATPLDTHG